MSNLKILFFTSLLFATISLMAEPYVDKVLLKEIGEKYKVFAKKDFTFNKKLLIN